VTAVPRWICSVRAAAAASTISGLDTANSCRWCSPTPKKAADLVGEHRLVDDVADRLRVAQALAVVAT
jgi:hypothetical protein